MRIFFLIAFISVMVFTASGSCAANAASNDDALIGIWIPQSAIGWHNSQLGRIRFSKLTIGPGSFALSNYLGTSSDIRGTYQTRSGEPFQTIDLNTEQIDLSAGGSPVQYPATAVPGIYKINGDLLTICIQVGSNPVRPQRFTSDLDNQMLLVFRRPDADFSGYPKQITLDVVGPDGVAITNPEVFQFMSFWRDKKDLKAQPGWILGGKISNTDGKWIAPYGGFRDAIARDTKRKLIGIVTASPAELQKGQATIHMQSECLLSGTLTCDELTKAGRSLEWANVYLLKNGEQIAMCESNNGEYHFPIAPGDYTLDAYGSLLLSKYVPITVPAGRADFQPAPIAMVASHLEMLKGHPAPELAGVVGWKGKPTALASLKGQYVLIDFWGYWCNPCVESMPVLMHLHDKYRDKGLAILTVHIDVVGNVDTAAKLDAKTAGFQKSVWNGRDLPFPTALSAGTNTPDNYDGITASQYGIHGYPTTILIDRLGNVVGQFEARDITTADAEIDRLLAGGH